MSSDGKRGRKELSDRDWLWGSRPRRLLLEHVLRELPPDFAGWTKSDLAEMAGVSKNGGVDEHADCLVTVGVLAKRQRRYWPTHPRSVTTQHIESLLLDLTRLRDEPPLSRMPVA